MRRLAIAIIKGYKRSVSSRTSSRCVFEPSCSTYAILAIERNGVGRGLAETIGRLRRCRAENLGVVDYPKGVSDLQGHEHRSQLL
jgi:putative membrane protein insertion efficiency factor